MRNPQLLLAFAFVGFLYPITGHADTLYVSNRGGHSVLKITESGVNSVYATSGLVRPEGLAFDTLGNLYVADDSLNTVFKFTPCGDGSIFSNTNLLVSYPTAEAFDAAGNLYVANYTHNAIVKLTPAGEGSIFTKNVTEPDGLAFDNVGNLYVANAGNNTISRFTPDGVGSVFASTNLSYPSGPAFDSAGNLYVANQLSYTIAKITPGGIASIVLTKDNGINWPGSVAFDSAGNLYVTNYGDNTILKFAPGGSIGSVFASGLNGPNFMVIQRAAPPSMPSLSGSPSFTYHDFATPTGLQFNGSAAAANNCDGAVLQLTASAASQAGSAFTANPVPLAPNAAFSTFFTFRLSKAGGAVDSDGVQGGDGIAFVIQGVSSNVVGTASGGIGYGGIAKSLAVEFDTVNDGTSLRSPGDPDGNHIAINLKGTLNDPASVPVSDPMNNGNVWYAWIDYSGVSQRLEVRLSEIPVRPETNILSTTLNLPSILSTTNAYVGFTAGTGTGWNEQDILSWKFAATPTLRFTGHLALTNTPPGFVLTNGILVREFSYQVSEVWYTNHYLYPVTFTNQTDGSVALASPPESGLFAGLDAKEGMDAAAILAEYGQTATMPQASGLMVGLLANVSPAFEFQSPDLTGASFGSMFPGFSESEIQNELESIASPSNRWRSRKLDHFCSFKLSHSLKPFFLSK
jgi:Legume lectin domain